MRNLEATSQMSQPDQHAGELKEAQTGFLRVTHDQQPGCGSCGARPRAVPRSTGAVNRRSRSGGIGASSELTRQATDRDVLVRGYERGRILVPVLSIGDPVA